MSSNQLIPMSVQTPGSPNVFRLHGRQMALRCLLASLITSFVSGPLLHKISNLRSQLGVAHDDICFFLLLNLQNDKKTAKTTSQITLLVDYMLDTSARFLDLSA